VQLKIILQKINQVHTCLKEIVLEHLSTNIPAEMTLISSSESANPAFLRKSRLPKV